MKKLVRTLNGLPIVITVRAILGNVKSMADMFGNVAARNWWQEWIKSQAARWSTEAEKGRKQIAAL